MKLDKSRLDGIIEKLSRGATSVRLSGVGSESINHQRKIDNLEKVKSSLAAARMEKERLNASTTASVLMQQSSSLVRIEKAISVPKITNNKQENYTSQRYSNHLHRPNKAIGSNAEYISLVTGRITSNIEHPAANKTTNNNRKYTDINNEHQRHNMPITKTTLSEIDSPFISCTSAIKGQKNICGNNKKDNSTNNSVSNNNYKSALTLSIAEVVDSQKVIAQSIATCMKMKNKQKVTLSDSFEPISHQHHQNKNGTVAVGAGQLTCSCCIQSSESIVEMLCPQVASYDLRMLQKYQQAHRLRKAKNNKNNNNSHDTLSSSEKTSSLKPEKNGKNRKNISTTAHAPATTTTPAAKSVKRPKQYGVKEAFDDFESIKEAQSKYQQLFLINYQEGIRKQLQLEPTATTSANCSLLKKDATS